MLEGVFLEEEGGRSWEIPRLARCKSYRVAEQDDKGGENETLQAAEGQWLGGGFALDTFLGHAAVLLDLNFFCFIGKVWLQLVGMLLGRDHHRPWPQVSPFPSISFVHWEPGHRLYIPSIAATVGWFCTPQPVKKKKRGLQLPPTRSIGAGYQPTAKFHKSNIDELDPFNQRPHRPLRAIALP